MFQDFKVDILGTECAVCFVDEFPERLGEYQDNADGLCNRYSREIFVKRCKDKSVTEQGRERSEKDTLRHELLYAYFAESGLPQTHPRHTVPGQRMKRWWIGLQFSRQRFLRHLQRLVVCEDIHCNKGCGHAGTGLAGCPH